jgi:hypothetical protein
MNNLKHLYDAHKKSEYRILLMRGLIDNSIPEVYDRTRSLFDNGEYDMKKKDGSFKIATAEQLAGFRSLYEARKRNPNLDLKVGTLLSLTMLTISLVEAFVLDPNQRS